MRLNLTQTAPSRGHNSTPEQHLQATSGSRLKLGSHVLKAPSCGQRSNARLNEKFNE